MAYGLPARGQHDYDDELNNSMEYVRGLAEAAKAQSDSAISTANAASSRADSFAASTDAQTAQNINAGTQTQAALSATIGAAVGPGSDAWIKAVGGDFGFAFTASLTMDSTTGLPTAGAIQWPDGRPGAFAGTVDANYYTGYTATYVPASGPTRTLTATGITYDSPSGMPLGPTGLAVA